VERFVRLGNQIQNRFGAKLLLVGGEADMARAKAIKGMTAVELVDWTGSLTLAELGALAEVADVYIGNDTGPTHIAAAMGCNTIAIFGPSNPRFSAPYGSEQEKVQVLWAEEAAGQQPFDWTDGVQVADVFKAVSGFLA
jgi:ADP-heptose:LPS heptosyltransferase